MIILPPEESSIDRRTVGHDPQPAIPPRSPRDGGATELVQQLRCIRDQRASAFRQTNPRAAAIGAANANLMEVEAHLSDAFRNAMELQPLTVDNLPKFLPTINKIERLTKLSNRNTELEIELTDTQKLAGSKPPQKRRRAKKS